jgi:NarL family two-component system response regulator LiaR
MGVTIRVLITDDHAIVRKGIRALLMTEADIQVVGEASDGSEAVAQVPLLKPDVVLMDMVMPKMDGIEATRQITAQHPKVHVLVLTSFAADDKVFPAIKAGALGYLLKDSSPDELVKAIRQVHRGEPPTLRRTRPRPTPSRGASWTCCASSPRGRATKRSPKAWSSPR